MKKKTVYLCIFSEKGRESVLWHRNLGDSLEEMGHTVLIPQGIPLLAALHQANDLMWNKAQREELSEKILLDFKKQLQANKHIDLFIAYLFPQQFSPHLFTEIANLGIPTVYFFCDNFQYRDILAADYAKYPTLNWVPEIDAIPFFKASKSNYIWLPMAANPHLCKPIKKEEHVDISFVGAKLAYRRDLLSILLHQEFSFRVYGQGWAAPQIGNHVSPLDTATYSHDNMFRLQSYLKFKWLGLQNRISKPYIQKNMQLFSNLGIEYEKDFQQIASQEYYELTDIYAHSKISIGINDQIDVLNKNPIVIYSKLRDFETTMSGACVLTQGTSEQPHLFEIGTDIEVYHTKEELLEKTRYLLKSPAKRLAMRAKAREKSLNSHTWQHRFEKLFNYLNIF